MSLFNEIVSRVFTSGLLDGIRIEVTITRLSDPAPVGTKRAVRKSAFNPSAYVDTVIRVVPHSEGRG